jgi:UDP-N-acetylglucosamine--N-acetylmuramyl-(pentapeptide) pyrophosphoryl-undecaprenol N-acetylglucosamine transferase
MGMDRIAIACGGTGGHLYPGLSVASELVRQGRDVRIYISEKEIDRTAMKDFPQFKAIQVPVIGWPGLRPRIVPFFLRLWKGYRQACRELDSFRPDAVLGMGGFTCAPLLLVAHRRSIPSYLHESNAIPGKVTRLLATRVKRVLLGFEACAAHLPGTPRVTGTPVRESLTSIDREQARQSWGLKPGGFTIAVLGGSQGASGLNDLIIRAASELKEHHPEIQWIHLSGREEDTVRRLHQANGVRAEVTGFCHQMERVYSACDLVVSRSGAATLSEISSYGLPSVLVPYPHAAEAHQERNAEVFVRAAASEMVLESDSAEEELCRSLHGLISDPTRREAMGKAALAMDMQGAARRVADELLHES